jgi:acetyl esterase/lipase
MAVVLHLHGGGFALGDLDEERAWCTRFSESGFLVVSPEYRLAPESPYPAALEDVWAVLRTLPRHLDRWDAERLPLVVTGLSAGGNLAAALCLRDRDSESPAIRFQVLNQPCLDPRLQTASVNLPHHRDIRVDLGRITLPDPLQILWLDPHWLRT